MYCQTYSCKMTEQACRIRRRNNPNDMGCEDCETGQAVAQRYEKAQAKLKKTEENLSAKNNKHQKSPSKKNKKNYTAKEIQFLKDNINKMSDRELGAALNRGHGAISVKLSGLGLKRNHSKSGGSGISAKPEKKIVEKIDSSEIDFFIIDFEQHKELYEAFKKHAESQFRTPQQQILYLISNELKRFSYDNA